MKALGPLTYLRRNQRKTLPLIGVIVLAVMLICGIVSLINSIPLSVRVIYQYSSLMMGVTPRGDAGMTDQIRPVILKESPVPIGRIATCRASETEVRSIVGPWTFAVIAVGPDDAKFTLDRLGVTKVNGRMPKPGAPEAVITEPVARNLKLNIGDVVLAPDKNDGYSPQEVKVVGIAETRYWFILADLDYYRVNHFPPIDLLLVFAKDPARQGELDAWAMERFKGERARIVAYSEIERQSKEMFNTLYRILDVVIGTLVIVITVMMGMLINIHLTQRTQEFALLQALGYTKRAMALRVVVETVMVVMLGWLLGLATAFGMLRLCQIILMDPNAYAIDIVDTVALRYTVPVPLAILAVSLYTLWSHFRTFDPVGVVERRLV